MSTDLFFDVKRVERYVIFFKTCIKENKSFPRIYELVRNIGYNSQYLEFLNNAITNNRVHFVIENQLIKTFIITGIGVIESILYYVLKSNNLHNLSDYKVLTKYKANEKNLCGSKVKIETILYIKLDNPEEENMNLNSLLKTARNNKIFGQNRTIYDNLNELRKLRNKIHLYRIDKNLDHDFNNFSSEELDNMKEILRSIFSSNLFDSKEDDLKQLFDFLYG